MKAKIQKLLKKIEKEKQIKIIFAIENGSRAWRMESKNSDYDVRFVFIKPLKDYFMLNVPTDVITKTYNREGKPTAQEGCFIDIEGFDIMKFVRMLSSSNPTVIEWLCSDIVYLGNQSDVFINYAKNNFKPISLYFHYSSMCKQNYLKYIKTRHLISYKKYLYAMRGLINALYVKQFNKVPPINFIETINKIVVPLIIKDKLIHIINLKKLGLEKDIKKNISEFDKFIETFLKTLEANKPEKITRATDSEINEEIWKILNTEQDQPKEEELKEVLIKEEYFKPIDKLKEGEKK